MPDEQLKEHISRLVAQMTVAAQQRRYMVLAGKVGRLEILTKSELAELIILRDALQRHASNQTQISD